MRLAFIGADHEVTGSCHFLEVRNTRAPIDCDTEQEDSIYQNTELPVEHHETDCVFLTHTHIDRAGMPPQTHAGEFRDQVITAHATADLCSAVLEDSAHIQEVKAGWKDRKARRTGRSEVEVLYTMQDIEDVLRYSEDVAHGQIFKLNDNLTLRFTDAKHLLESTSIETWATKGAGKKKVVSSGDIGNKNRPLIHDPQYIMEADYVVVEATYGNRYYKKDVNHMDSLARAAQETLSWQENVVAPASTVERTQELLYLIRHIKEERLVTGHGSSEAYIDSPLAVEVTHMFKDSIPEYYDGETKALVERGINPINLPGLKFSIINEESRNINLDMTPKAITSAAGMCGAGRIRYHLKHNLWKPECSVVLVKYQAEGTLGRTLQDRAQTAKIFGEGIDAWAHIKTMKDINGHTGRDGLITRISAFEKRSNYVFMVHGSKESCVFFTDVLNTQLKLVARAPFSGSQFDLIKGFWIKETEGILTKKETAAKRRASGVYARLVDAGKMLLGVIHRNEDGANKDLVHFTGQILALCDRWGRQNVTDRRS